MNGAPRSRAVRAACAVGLLLLGCARSKSSVVIEDAGATADASPSAREVVRTVAPAKADRFSAPIAATHLADGDVIVAGLDVASKSIVAQQIDPHDEITNERVVLDDVAWSSAADLRLFPIGSGASLVWRGKRHDVLGRQLVVLDEDLAVRGDPVDLMAGSCATHDVLFSTDGQRIQARSWSGGVRHASLPKDSEALLACGATRAFAIAQEENQISIWSFHPSDALHGPVTVFSELDFGNDELREHAEYTIDDDLGIVRVASSGAVAIREIKMDAVGQLRRTKKIIAREDDVVAVDASSRAIVVVYTEESSNACRGNARVTESRTKVMALRVDRGGDDEAVFELSPGTCGREIGPFFTGVLGNDIAVAWVERVSIVGTPRAPIAGLSYRVVRAAGEPMPLSHIDQPADALVDAGCDGKRCFAVALVRKAGADGRVPGMARVLRYP
ncbi:MAG: hypothetical protein FWD69_15995 [Polyangiaceae bacterium]|nr:hypothetical protein [Polyangiaceae bacterium]